MTPRHQARLDAAAALLDAGWSTERIALALTISRATIERLMPPPAILPALPPSPIDGCCRVIADLRLRTSRYCDGPVMAPGAVYCARHTRGGVWAS